MEQKNDNIDILVNNVVTMHEGKKKSITFERIIRKKIISIVNNFKPYFIESIQWAPISLDDTQIFPFSMLLGAYDRSILYNSEIKDSPVWNKHLEKIQEYFDALDEIKNINPMSIPSHNITSVFIAYCICTIVFIILYALSIILYASKKLNGEIFWTQLIPIYALVTVFACVITYYMVSRRLKEQVRDRATEIYLLTFYYNTNYFADYNLYIHMGVFSSWINIGPILDTDYVEDPDTLDSEIMQRNLTFDPNLLNEIKIGTFVNKLKEIGGKDRMEIHEEAVKSKNNKDKKEMLMNSMTASFFFPSTNTSKNTGKVVLHKQNNKATNEMSEKLAVDGKAFLKDFKNKAILEHKNVLNLFTAQSIKGSNKNNEIKKLGGNGMPREHSADEAINSLARYINISNQQKVEYDLKNQKEKPTEKKADDKSPSKETFINESVVFENTTYGTSPDQENKDMEIGIELSVKVETES